MDLREATKNVQATVQGSRSVTKPWRRRAWMAVLAVAIVGAGTFVVVGHPPLAIAALVGVAVHLAIWFFRILWRAEWTYWKPGLAQEAWFPKARLAAIVLVPAATALAVVLLFARGRSDLGGYIAAVAGYVTLGIALSHWRRNQRRTQWWGPVLLLTSAAIGLVSLVVATVNVSGAPLVGVLLAVLVFPTGIALVSEDLAVTRPAPNTVVSVAGVAAVAAGLAGFALANIGAYQALLLTIALVAVVALISSNTSHDIVLVLIVILLVWSLEPSKPIAEPDPHDGARTIVALGDSYMSGEGARQFYENTNHDHDHDGVKDRNECRRAPTSYPIKTAALLNQRHKHDKGYDPFDVLFLACSGAKAHQLTTDAQYVSEPSSLWTSRGAALPDGFDGQAQLPQAKAAVDALHLKPEIVLVSIGGNDAGFGDLGKTCGLAGDCSVLGQAWLTDLKNTGAKVADVYAQVKAAFPDARILVVPYPVPLNESGCSVSLLRPNEHRFIAGFARALDRVLQEKAAAAGIDFLDRGVDVFTDKRLRICDVTPSKAAVNQLAASPVAGVFLQKVSPRGWFHNTFHPNARGHAILADAIADWIDHPSARAIETTTSDAPEINRKTDLSAALEDIMGDGFDHCFSKVRTPATCHGDRTAWMVAAMTRLLWAILLPVLLTVGGALLLSVEARRRWAANGTGPDRAA